MLKRLVPFSIIWTMIVVATIAGTAQAPVQADEKKAVPIIGPAKINLGDNLAEINLPENYAFVNKEDTARILDKMGSPTEGALGMIVPRDSEGKTPSYLVICRFEDTGYVKDDDAGKLNADEILKQYKEGTKEGNEERKSKGVEPIYVGGWSEKPRYEKDTHEVIWAIQVKDKDEDSAPVVGVNYNTRILGRRGVLSMNLVTDPDKLEQHKLKVKTLLDSTTFVKGQTYADYKQGDKAAGFGLTGLILGGGAAAVAAKMGLFGVLWKWIIGIVLVLKKFIIVAIAGLGAFFARIFGKKGGQGGQQQGGPPQ
jgi:uncharacterized membrane-anchored protein